MLNKQIKINFIEDCPEVELTLWALKEELSKDNTFIFVKTVEEADLVVASRHYFIQEELDKIQGRKLIWVNYGATLKSYTNVPLTKTKDHHSYDASEKMWLVVGLSPNYIEALNNYKLDTSRVRFLGYPKMDLINYNYNVTVKDLGVNPNNKTVLYTPTLGWQACTCQSSFFDYINKLVYWSLEYNFNLIVRPHPYFLKQFPEARALLENINKLDNVKVDFCYNYYVLFKLVDFIISDVSSLAYEFLITTKPVILTRTSLKKEKLFQDYTENNIMYEVKNSNELENRIRLLLNNNDEFKNRRLVFVNDLPKNSSKLIKEYIKENYR